MVDVKQLKDRVCEVIDSHREEIIALGEDIRVHPELGFKEFRTAGLVVDRMTALGIPHQTGIAITGVKGMLEGAADGPTVAYMGELDSVLVPDHPDADPETGAAHACGHNAQIANLIALAYGLVESGVMAELDGNVALIAVPAEEYVEVEYRLGLKEEGKVEFLGGKPEFIRLGALDDVDITFMTHQANREQRGILGMGGPSNGCVVKQIRYQGRAAHAGGSPHLGINALKAATLALQCIDANRETFQDEDHIRVHPIITKGGDLVNVVPADVRLETYVRGASVEAILEAAAKVDRSLKAGAMAMGATLHLTTLPGYLPRVLPDGLVQVYKRNAVALVGEEGWGEPEFGAGSTDMGDVSHIMPAIEAQAGGACGVGHGADYTICDEEVAYVLPAKAAAMTIVDLLANDAKGAQEVIDDFEPPMSKESYLSFVRDLSEDIVWSMDGEEKA
ncbi:MAG: amidohydrolase [Chloroflexota bacterium]|nr:amidohydrolase [Chloroflexota bacterium]